MTALRAVVLVEGNSDRVALHALAERDGRDLTAEGIEIVAMGGITNTRTFASRYGPQGLDLPLTGLYDAAEEAKVRRRLTAAGLRVPAGPEGLTGLGFYKCSADLEGRRFLGVRAGRKARYAALLVQALERDRVPEPLAATLARASFPPW